MNTLEIEGKKYEFPSEWNEINQQQILVLSTLAARKMPVMDFKLQLLFSWLKLSKLFLYFKNKVFFLEKKHRILPFLIPFSISRKQMKVIDHSDIYLLTETVDFLFDTNEDKTFLSSQLTKNLLPRIKNLYGPMDEFRDLTVIEFAKADHRFISFRASGEPHLLDEMCAILYRPKKRFLLLRRFFGYSEENIRVKFRQSILDAGKKTFEKIDFRNKYAVYLFWEGCRNMLKIQYPHVFNQPSSEDDGFGWAGIIDQLKNNTCYGEDSLLHTVLLHIEMAAIEREKQKRK